MRDDLIEAEHKKYKEFLQEHNLKVGSTVKIKKYREYGDETITEMNITYINPHYGWFGSGDHPIKPEDIVFDQPGVKNE
jgi:hypothetical protein